MAHLKSLIENQTIHIDPHHRGIEHNFYDKNQDVHIHKEFKNEDKKKKLTIKIPLNSEKSVYISKNIPAKIKEEIYNVLNDRKEREFFLNEVYGRLSSDWKWIDDACARKEIADKISKAFGLILCNYVNISYKEDKVIKLVYFMQDKDCDTKRLYRMIFDLKKGFSIGEVNLVCGALMGFYLGDNKNLR